MVLGLVSNMWWLGLVVKLLVIGLGDVVLGFELDKLVIYCLVCKLWNLGNFLMMMVDELDELVNYCLVCKLWNLVNFLMMMVDELDELELDLFNLSFLFLFYF